MKRSNLISACLILIALVLFGRVCADLWHHTVDDSYITFRYAQNMATGHGITFNYDRSPIEGYTSFLWMLIMAIPSFLRADPVLFSKIVGILAILGTAILGGRFIAEYTSDDKKSRWNLPASIGVFIFSCYQYAGLHAVSGMETAIYTLLLTAFLYALTDATGNASPRRQVRVALIALLMGLTRPEGNLVAFVGMGAGILLTARSERRSFLKAAVSAYILPAACYFGWRYHYYGLPLPLPFYIKVASRHGLAGLPEVRLFVDRLLPLAFFVVPAVVKHRKAVLPAACAAAAFLVFFTKPEHIMGYGFRFLFPILPFLCVCAGIGIPLVYLCFRGLSKQPGRRAATILIALCLIVIVCRTAEGMRKSYDSKFYHTYANGMESAHIPLGKVLGKLRRNENDRPLLVIGDCGAVPFYSQWNVLDSYGLNNVHIATTHKHDVDYIIDQNPDLVILISKSGTKFESPLAWENDLYRACISKRMDVVERLTFSDIYYLWVFGKADNPMAQQLARLGNLRASTP